MRFYWLLPSTLSIFLLSSPAEAARLKFWRFDANQNRLDFKTDGKVQPNAKLIFNPTRLVIDLPRTTMKRPTVKQQVGGAIRSIRIGQFNNQTTRMVIELNSGYKLDPQQVQFQSASPSQWTVKLPTPQRVASVAPDLLPPQPLGQSSASNPGKIFPIVVPKSRSPVTSSLPLERIVGTGGAIVQVQKVHVTPDGFFIRTQGGGTPQIKVNRSSDRTTINVDLTGATLSPRFPAPDLPVNRFGVSRIQLFQVQTSPSVVRMTLRVNKNSPDWQATVSRFGGVVVVPTGGFDNATVVDTRLQPVEDSVLDPPRTNPLPGVATIQSVQIAGDGTQLLIRATQPLTYASGWDLASGFYRITLTNAQLDSEVKGPSLNANSPILRVRLQQPDPLTVVILVQPAAGVQIGKLNQPDVQLLSLQLQRSSTVLVPPSPSPSIIPVSPPSIQTPVTQLPRVPKGRLVVIIDPRLGGKDPGAFGLGGLQEKNVILPIAQQIAALLEQQGVQAVLTRKTDYFVDLAPRVVMAERMNADLFVSIHANSISNRPDVNGLETYYYNSGGQRLARIIHNNILQSVNIPNRGVRRARFYVVRKTSMPSVLVEVGFVTGRVDSSRLATSAYQNQMAAAIMRGILQYIQQNF